MRLLGTFIEDSRAQQWVPWILGLIAAGLAAKNLLGNYADFGIYLDVAREVRAGEIDLYRDRAESGPWAYPHIAALPFVALDAMFGDTGARIVWSMSLGFATVWLLRSMSAVLAQSGGLKPKQWLVFGILFQRCIAQNLTNGQLSLLVGAMVTAGIAALVRGRDTHAGMWLGLAAALKVTPGLFLLALPLMGRTRSAVAMAATTAFTVLVVPWPFCGTSEHLRHLHDFWHAATSSVTSPETASIVQWYAGPNVKGALDYLLQPRPLDHKGHTVNLFAVDDVTLNSIKFVWSVTFGGLLVAWFWHARRLADSARLSHQAAAIVIAMSVFAPLLRVYHLSAALVPFALFCRGPRQRTDILWWIAAGGTLLTMTLRQKNLIGEKLWRAFDGGAFLHFTIVLMVAWLLRETMRSPAATPPR